MEEICETCRTCKHRLKFAHESPCCDCSVCRDSKYEQQPKNSDRLKVGQVWTALSATHREVTAIDAVNKKFSTKAVKSGCLDVWGFSVIDDKDSSWQLISEPKPKTLADLGVRVGTKILHRGLGRCVEVGSINFVGDNDVRYTEFHNMQLVD